MILYRIKINNFGLFTSEIINFISTLTVIFGPNESGKTTLLRAINFLKNCNKLKYEKNYNFNLKDMKISPSIEYYLNPSFFGIEKKNTPIIPIIFRCSHDKSEIVNISEFNDSMDPMSFMELIKNKLDIIFWEENFLVRKTGVPNLSSGETIFEEMKKLSKNTKNKLILLDNITQFIC